MESKASIKVIVTGLDNAGKTSYLTVLEKIYSFEEIVKFLKPTLGVHYTKRQYFNKELFYWDFGGQEEFRDKYLRNKQYFKGTDLMYYLIDIQDEERFDKSVEYLGEIVKILTNNNHIPKIPIHILFSKSDFEVIKDQSFDFIGKTSMIHNLLEKFYPEFKFRFHYTSIYDLMTIISVHVRSMREIIPLFDELDKIVDSFAHDNPIMRIVLADHTGLPFLNYTPINYWLDQNQPLIDKMAGFQLQLFRQIEEKEFHISDTYAQSDKLQTYFFTFKADKLSDNIVSVESIFEQFFGENDDELGGKDNTPGSNYYLILYTPLSEKRIEEEELNKLIVEFKTLLVKFDEIFT